jgi:hypothetical protein
VLCRDVGIGLNVWTVPCSIQSCVVGEVEEVGVATKSLGTVSGAPYTSSTDDVRRSSFGAVRIPRKTQGNSSTQLGLVTRACSADLRCR